MRFVKISEEFDEHATRDEVVPMNVENMSQRYGNHSEFYNSSPSYEHNDDSKVMAHEEEVVGGIPTVGTQYMSVKQEGCKGKTSHISPDFYDSNLTTKDNQDFDALVHEDDSCKGSSHANTHCLGVTDAFDIEDTCHNEFDFSNQTLEDGNKTENVPNGDGSEESLTDVCESILIGEVYVELGKSAASSMSFEPPHEVHNKSDITSLPQDMAAFGQEENNDLHSRLEGTHSEIMSYDNVNNTIHHKSDFVHFGTADIEQSQRMNEGWLVRAKQAKLIVHQAKLQLQHIHDTHHHIGKEEQELSNSDFSIDIGYFLHGGDGIDNEAHSGPTTNELSLIGIEGVPNAPLILSPLSYDKAA